jgi:cysteine-rich repeat protein
LQSVWGSGHTDVFAVGDDGTLLHYDGQSWQPMESPTGEELYGAWGSGHADVFAVGDDGTLLHYNGDSWARMGSGTANTLVAAWGPSAQETFVVENNGNIYRRNGFHTDCQSHDTCGNGFTDEAQGEECDDGNVSPGDGCDACCGIETVPEREPNEDGTPEVGDSSDGNDFSTMNANYSYEADTIISATLEPAGDEDVFMVTNSGWGWFECASIPTMQRSG